MKLKLLHKIFLANISVILMLALVLLSFSYYGFKSVTAYIDDAEEKRENFMLENLTSALIQHYQRHQNWNKFKSSPQEWRHFLRQWHDNSPFASNPIPLLGRAKYNGMLPPHEQIHRPPPIHTGEPPRNRAPEHIFNRLILLDRDKKPLFYQRRAADDGLMLAVVVNEETIGWLKFIQITNQQREGMNMFKQQLKNVVILTLAGILLAALVSFYLARHFIDPIRNLIKGAINLSERNFEAKITLNSKDEFAELAHYFNETGSRLSKFELQQKQWLQDIAHELRTPLTLIRGEVEAMVDGVTEADAKNLLLLKGDILRLNHLINDLHELSVTDNLSLNRVTHPVKIAGICQALSDRFTHKLSARHINLITHFEQTTITGDENRIHQVLTNLLENCARYSEENGSLWFNCFNKDRNVIITIEDSGPGVNNETLSLMFDRLYRADSHRNRKFGGSGLGLAISHNIINAHDGTIGASHSNKGGLKIEIILPALFN